MSAAMQRLRDRVGNRRKRWLERFLKSRGPLTPPFDLVYRRIFILPSGFGWVFGGLLAVMTIGGLNFNNNLGLLLTFMLAASAHATLHMAYSNLRGIRVLAIDSQPVFAGDTAQLTLTLQDPAAKQRPGIEAAIGKIRAAGHLPAAAKLTLHLSIPTQHRGWLYPGRIKLNTSYPLGLFTAWSWCEAANPILVYPRPAQDPPPLPQGWEDQGAILRLRDGEDLVGIRDYQQGDPLPSIAWKASARHQQLQTKLLAQPVGERLVLDWYQLGGFEVEERLSILCAWVLTAHHGHHEYRLRLPGTELGPGQGVDHRNQCLRALALFGVE